MEFRCFDAAYVERLRAGDFRTQENFCSYFSEFILIKLRSRLKSLSAMEDVRQEIFARFFVNLRAGKIQEPERLGAYVNSMCNNVLRESYRFEARHNLLPDEEAEDIPDKGRDLVDIIAAKQTHKRVHEVLENLPERDRRIIREIFLEERDKDEVCRDFGVDRDYLRVLMHRAKQSFKALFTKDIR